MIKNKFNIFAICLALLALAFLVLIISRPGGAREIANQSGYRLLAQNKMPVWFSEWPEENHFFVSGTGYILDIPEYSANEFIDISVNTEIIWYYCCQISQNISVWLSLDGQDWDYIDRNMKAISLIGNEHFENPQNDSFFFFGEREEVTFRILLPSKYKNQPFQVKINYAWRGWVRPGWPKFDAILMLSRAAVAGR